MQKQEGNRWVRQVEQLEAIQVVCTEATVKGGLADKLGRGSKRSRRWLRVVDKGLAGERLIGLAKELEPNNIRRSKDDYLEHWSAD